MDMRNASDRSFRGVLMAVMAAALLVASAVLGEVAPDRPAACPLRFDQPTTGLQRTCLFVGRFNGSDRELFAAFAGDGAAVVVAIARDDAEPLLYLPAEVDSATSGTLVRWQAGAAPVAAQATGTLTLEDGGRLLRLRARGPTGEAGASAEFVARFALMVNAAETVLSQR
jgi:hypothetical protein